MRWDPKSKSFLVSTVKTWLDADEHLQSALALVGGGALGKSKLSHMLATELTIGYAKEQYIFSKALDPLGVLSHCGELRKSGAIVMTDFEMKAARGNHTMGLEARV